MTSKIDPRRLESLGDALADLGAASRPAAREGFASSLRDRILVEARALETSAAEAFQNALDGIRVDGSTAALASFATALAPRAKITAPQGLRDGLRNTLTGAKGGVASLAASRANRSALARLRSSARSTAAAVLVASVLTTSAVAVAASGTALPGDALYSVKRFREHAQTWGISGLDEGLRSLVFARTRVGELESLARLGNRPASDFAAAAEDLRRQTLHGTALILAAGDDPGAEAALAALTSFVSTGQARLEAISALVPADARPALASALEALAEAASRTEAVSSTCLGCQPPKTQTDPAPLTTTRPCLVCTPSAKPAPIVAPTVRPTPPPAPRPTPPAQPPKLDPVPDPDRLPNLPGRTDDSLEDPLRRIIEEFITSL